jgi:hypothetical protein
MPSCAAVITADLAKACASVAADAPPAVYLPPASRPEGTRP